jgi:hypothetical protein
MATQISSSTFETPRRSNGRSDEPALRAGNRLMDEVRGQVTSTVNAQKNRAAAGLGGVAEAIRHAGDELRSENESLALYIDRASEQLRQLADQIREKGAEDIATDVAEFARRRPAVFIGGAFIIGLGLARFLKSTAPGESGSRRDPGASQAGPWTPAGPDEPATSLEEHLARSGGGF